MGMTNKKSKKAASIVDVAMENVKNTALNSSIKQAAGRPRSNGNPGGKRKKAEEDIVFRQALFDHTTDAIAMIDEDHKVIEANANFAALLGYPLNEISKL
jgi:PAS domain-containing protein